MELSDPPDLAVDNTPNSNKKIRKLRDFTLRGVLFLRSSLDRVLISRQSAMSSAKLCPPVQAMSPVSEGASVTSYRSKLLGVSQQSNNPDSNLPDPDLDDWEDLKEPQKDSAMESSEDSIWPGRKLKFPMMRKEL